MVAHMRGPKVPFHMRALVDISHWYLIKGSSPQIITWPCLLYTFGILAMPTWVSVIVIYMFNLVSPYNIHQSTLQSPSNK